MENIIHIDISFHNNNNSNSIFIWGLYFLKALFEELIKNFWSRLYLEGLMYRGKFAFKIDWASLILGRKFTVFLCFTLYLRAIFQVQGGAI